MNNVFSLSLIDKIIPKQLNPFKTLKAIGEIKQYASQAKTAAIEIGILLAAILIALIILIIKKTKK